MSRPDPYDLMNEALTQEPGVGVALDFGAWNDRESMVFALYNRRALEKRRSRKMFAPSDPEYDSHPWGTVQIRRIGNTSLWIGRAKEPKRRDNVALDNAEKQE